MRFIQQTVTRAGAREIIERYNLKTRKKLGQHYLVDPHVLEKIIRAADITERDCVLEIGSGIGAVTQALDGRAGHVCAVELDAALIPVLNGQFAGRGNISVIHGDILKMDIEALLEPYAALNMKVVANLPYYITTPVIFKLLEQQPRFESFTVMVQREVAERFAAKPGSKAYGALTLAVDYHADARIAAYVPPNCFMPRPNVDSAVAHLSVLPKPRVSADKARLFNVIHAAFNQRRKTLVNALSAGARIPGAPLEGLTKAAISDALAESGFPPDIRGEALTLENFAALTGALFK